MLIEIKAATQLDDLHLAQALNYLKVYELDVGLLLNFGSVKLEYKRLYRKK